MWSPSEARVVFQLTAAEADSEPLPAAAYGINLNCFHLPGPPFPCLVLQKKKINLRKDDVDDATAATQCDFGAGQSHSWSHSLGCGVKSGPKRRPAVCAVTRWLCWPHIGLGPGPKPKTKTKPSRSEPIQGDTSEMVRRGEPSGPPTRNWMLANENSLLIQEKLEKNPWKLLENVWKIFKVFINNLTMS